MNDPADEQGGVPLADAFLLSVIFTCMSCLGQHCIMRCDFDTVVDQHITKHPKPSFHGRLAVATEEQ